MTATTTAESTFVQDAKFGAWAEEQHDQTASGHDSLVTVRLSEPPEPHIDTVASPGTDRSSNHWYEDEPRTAVAMHEALQDSRENTMGAPRLVTIDEYGSSHDYVNDEAAELLSPEEAAGTWHDIRLSEDGPQNGGSAETGRIQPSQPVDDVGHSGSPSVECGSEQPG
jgi:hypothetical protein